MQVDALAVELRPRPMMESTDLGIRMVQANAASVWLTYGPLWLAITALALASVEFADWLPGVVIFWLKPWLDRSLLFVLSRAVFGQSTRFGDLWQAQRQVWWSQLVSSLTMRRLSPWRSYTLPIYQLEGQNSSAGRQRRNQLLSGHRDSAIFMHLTFAHIELAFSLCFGALVAWLIPTGTDFNIIRWVTTEGGTSASLATSALYAVIVLFLEPFYVAAGFAMYLNRRVELEAWDIEQEFRRAFGTHHEDES